MPKKKLPQSIHVLAKPTGARCNLNCTYCFYLSKESLYPSSQFKMTADIQRQYIRQYVQTLMPYVNITWQGGEPTLMGIDFFERGVKFVQQYKKYNQQVNFSIQTNGILIDEKWCKFLKVNNFLVGLSLDGPPPYHNAHRVDKGNHPTFDSVLKSVKLLKEYQVDFNILCCLHSGNADHPLEVYQFLRDEVKAQFIQFIPIVICRKNRQDGMEANELSIPSEKYGNFLISVFDEWVRKDVGKIYVQLFDVTLANWVGEPPGLCIHSETCGNSLALEHNGDLYSCDHFVDPKYLLGNIKDYPISELAASERQQKFGLEKRNNLPRICLECPVKFACHGGCPKDRINLSPDGEPGLNYLCSGYRAFFNHVKDAMDFMTNEIHHKRPPANVMDWYRCN